MTLSERQRKYEDAFNYLITARPIIARCTVRNFQKTVRNLPRPFDPELWRILRETMHYTAMDVDGAILAYHYAGEINYILSNEDAFSNQLQKIGTVLTSLTTVNFMKHFLAADDPPDLIGEAIFETFVFAAPSLAETMNYLLWRQQTCMYSSVSAAAEAEMNKLYGPETTSQKLIGKAAGEKKDLLAQECNIKFEDRYPSFFKRGSASYKAPRIVKTPNGDLARKKWVLDTNVPDFIEDRDMIMNILHTGQDILRPERDIISHD